MPDYALMLKNLVLPDTQKLFDIYDTAKERTRLQKERDKENAMNQNLEKIYNSSVVDNGQGPKLDPLAYTRGLNSAGYGRLAVDAGKKVAAEGMQENKNKREEYLHKIGLAQHVLSGSNSENYGEKYNLLNKLGFDQADGLPSPEAFSEEKINGFMSQALSLKDRLQQKTTDQKMSQDALEAEKRLQLDQEKSAGNLGLSEKELAERIRANKAQEALRNKEIDTKKYLGEEGNKPKAKNVPEWAVKAAGESVGNIEKVANIKNMLAAPGTAVGLKAYLNQPILSRTDPEGVKLRGQVDEISAVIRNQLLGAAVSNQERKSVSSFLPSPQDNEETLRAKLDGLGSLYSNKLKFIRESHTEELGYKPPKTFTEAVSGSGAQEASKQKILPSGAALVGDAKTGFTYTPRSK